MNNIENLRYPIGEFEKPEPVTKPQIESWITEIELLPVRINKLTKSLSEIELDWQYRPHGWKIRQVVHHLADSHMNAFIRLKLSLTENIPTIKPYFEDKWAELPDVNQTHISESLKIIEGLHSRWIKLLKSLSNGDLKMEFNHPEYNRRISIEEFIGIYAWHSNHHLAHIKQALEYKGKFDK